MKRFKTVLLVFLIVLAACATPEANAALQADSFAVDCQLIYTFADGSRLLLCPADAEPPTQTPAPTESPAPTAVETSTPGQAVVPFPDAPACPSHDAEEWHGVWDSLRGCHYDHEHGQDPFIDEVAETFPGFDLRALLCGLGVGHCNPSGPMEFTHKHGGWKINVQLHHPETCAGFEGASVGVDGSVIGYHGFGDYAVELEAAVHSVFFLLRQCVTADPDDYGYMFVNQHVSYGEVASPYQGDLLSYPYYSVPVYDPAFGPYLTVPCIGQKLAGQRGACRTSLAQAQANENLSNWSAKPTGRGARPQNSTLTQLFWRVPDTPQAFDWRDQTYPYSLLWLCTRDGGASFEPSGCEYNNSQTQVHEIQGTIPASWDNLAGFDTDPRVGRITADGFVTRFGELNRSCTAVGVDCHPIKLVQAFVGKYGSILVFLPRKGTNVVELYPERDIYFCNGVVCLPSDPGAVPSGWIGEEN